jgi:hypothetical protein
MKAPSALSGTSPKYDSKITLANLNLHVGFGGGKCESAVGVGLVRVERLRQSVLRSPFEGRL